MLLTAGLHSSPEKVSEGTGHSSSWAFREAAAFQLWGHLKALPSGLVTVLEEAGATTFVMGILFNKTYLESDMAAHAFNHGTWEAEAGRLSVSSRAAWLA